MESFSEAMHGSFLQTAQRAVRSQHIGKKHDVENSKVLQLSVFVVIIVSVFTVLYSGVVPPLMEKIVVATLVPSNVEVCNFNGVHASPTSEGMKFQGQDILRAYINNEVLIDFTSEARTLAQHGYTKAASEWLIKTPFMGDEPVILSPSFALVVPVFSISVFFAILFTFILPTRLGLLSSQTERIARETRTKLLFQTGFSEELLDFLLLSDAEVTMLASNMPEKVDTCLQQLWEATRTEHERQSTIASYREESLFDAVHIADGHHAFVRNTLISRLREAFSPAVEHSVKTLQSARIWQQNHISLLRGVRLFMSEYFAPNCGNNVQGLAYAGAGFMIVVIGLRGLRFIPASRPSLIIASISLEFALLVALGITLYFQREEASSIESLKRIENNTQNVALVMSSVDSSTFQRAMHEAIRERIQSPEMDKRLAESLTQSFIDSLRTSPQSQQKRSVAHV